MNSHPTLFWLHYEWAPKSWALQGNNECLGFVFTLEEMVMPTWFPIMYTQLSWWRKGRCKTLIIWKVVQIHGTLQIRTIGSAKFHQLLAIHQLLCWALRMQREMRETALRKHTFSGWNDLDTDANNLNKSTVFSRSGGAREKEMLKPWEG